MPALARALLRRWLSLFDVTPRDELESFLSAIARRTGAHLRFDRLLRDYTQYAVLTLTLTAAPREGVDYNSHPWQRRHPRGGGRPLLPAVLDELVHRCKTVSALDIAEHLCRKPRPARAT